MEYVIKDGEVIIVDEFTGRLMPGRRWSEGLHQAVEAKENIRIAEEKAAAAYPSTLALRSLSRQAQPTFSTA